MLLLRETSRGRVLFDFSVAGGSFVGDLVRVYPLDERGWTGEGDWWRSNEPEHGTLADALVRAANLPRGEAEELADAAVDDWRKRGPEVLTRKERLGVGAVAIPTLTILGLIPLALLGAVVWLLIELV